MSSTTTTSIMTNTTPLIVPELPVVNFDNLSEDVKNYITNKPDQYDIIYSDITQIVKNNNSQCLDNTDLLHYFTSTPILQDKNLITYLRNKDDIFNTVYNKHYVQGSIDFIMMNRLESMCQCWLMYLYH
ncbi:hypothetical protein N9K75_02650 [bacterium]|nr:hypothetical protein [bacterium]